MISAILGGATALAAGISAISNFQQAKRSASEASAAANRLMGLQEADKYAALKTADISSLQSQKTAAQTAQATQALQGMGPEAAVGGVANLYQAGLQQEAENTQNQAALDMQTAQLKAANAQDIENKRIGRIEGVEGLRLQGAQQRAADARTAMSSDIAGVASGLGMGIEGLLATSNPYKRLSAEEKAKLGIF